MADVVAAALIRARADAAQPTFAPADGERRVRTLAVGDPQAPFSTFLQVLASHDVLGSDGRIRPDTALISLGDHFDWGKREERAQAADDALMLLSWLAAHPGDQVVMLAGNHDLARVGELAGFDDQTFLDAQRRADAMYDAKTDKKAAATDEERALCRELGVATAEVLARDLSTFRVAQRTLVDALLGAGRLRLAHARGDMLFVHAGITLREIDAVGVHLDTPAALAAALNRALDDASETRASTRRPLAIAGVHIPGDAEREGSGALYHRPAQDITDAQRREGRRFDPRTLPTGIVEVVGHIRDKKCRELLGTWCDDAPHALGVLRHLVVGARGVSYRHGTPETFEPRDAHVIFVDGGMNDLRDAPQTYQLLDVDRRRPSQGRP